MSDNALVKICYHSPILYDYENFISILLRLSFLKNQKAMGIIHIWRGDGLLKIISRVIVDRKG